ncbi:MAG: hypothetical protein RL154_538 [Pseudomonadota bacterium]|jgi:Xaa-Pro aminopeptidase
MTKLFRSEASIFYSINYSNDNCVLIELNASEKVLITDGRYSEEAKLKGGFKVVESRDLIKATLQILRKNRILKAMLDTTEWSAEEFLSLSKSPIFWLQKPNFASKLRAIKKSDEILKIEFACTYGKKAFDELSKKLKIGMSEQELAFEMTLLMNSYGKQQISFEPIVAFNSGASLPHYRPSANKLEQNSAILIDAGCKIDGYCSDMTRTAFFENSANFEYVQKFKNQTHQKAYDTVLKAHDLAIAKAKVGMKASELDKIARDVIIDVGFEKAFKHGLGHGVGLEIHEAPSVSFRSKEVLEEGMVFTIEPGIYLDGEFGVRIEDVVVLKSDGAHILGL